jgi:hypothetical protein
VLELRDCHGQLVDWTAAVHCTETAQIWQTGEVTKRVNDVIVQFGGTIGQHGTVTNAHPDWPTITSLRAFLQSLEGVQRMPWFG